MAHRLSPKVVRQAIEWSLRIGSDARLQEQCARWREAHADHEQAWQRIQALNSDLGNTFQSLPGSAMAFETLESSARRLGRRQALKLLSGTLVLGSGAWLLRAHTPWPAWSADFATGVGQCQGYRLADGSQLQLNTDSAVNLAGPGRLTLERGEILLECAGPVQVAGRHASFEAQAARFVIRQDAEHTRLSVLQGHLQMRLPGQTLDVQAGQHYWLGAGQARRLPTLDMEAGAWTEGLIVTRNMRLADFLSEVSRYRRGHLGCTDEIAGLRLSGVYRLQDIDQLLAVLPHSLPVRLNYRTRWWITVERQA